MAALAPEGKSSKMMNVNMKYEYLKMKTAG